MFILQIFKGAQRNWTQDQASKCQQLHSKSDFLAPRQDSFLSTTLKTSESPISTHFTSTLFSYWIICRCQRKSSRLCDFRRSLDHYLYCQSLTDSSRQVGLNLFLFSFLLFKPKTSICSLPPIASLYNHEMLVHRRAWCALWLESRGILVANSFLFCKKIMVHWGLEDIIDGLGMKKTLL